MGGNNFIGKLITWIIAIVIGIAVVKAAFALLGIVIGLTTFLLFTVLPIVLVGWVVVKVVQHLTRKDDYEPA